MALLRRWPRSRVANHARFEPAHCIELPAQALTEIEALACSSIDQHAGPAVTRAAERMLIDGVRSA